MGKIPPRKGQVASRDIFRMQSNSIAPKGLGLALLDLIWFSSSAWYGLSILFVSLNLHYEG